VTPAKRALYRFESARRPFPAFSGQAAQGRLGLWSAKVFARLARAAWSYSIGVCLQPHVRAAIEQIPEQAWQTLADYPPNCPRGWTIWTIWTDISPGLPG
jgi:hypothetical protein